MAKKIAAQICKGDHIIYPSDRLLGPGRGDKVPKSETVHTAWRHEATQTIIIQVWSGKILAYRGWEMVDIDDQPSESLQKNAPQYQSPKNPKTHRGASIE